MTKQAPDVKPDATSGAGMRFSVLASVKDEGPFLVEWICWYRRLGFDEIVLVSNDCTDHSPALLDALEAKGWITHLRHDVPDGQNICAKKLEAAKRLPQISEADWVLVCDVDEFLTIHTDEGKIRDLIPPDAGFLAMALNWRVFGTSGRKSWEDGLVHRQFTKAALTEDETSSWIKMIHAKPNWFRKLAEHGPKGLGPRHQANWGKGRLRVVNADGQEIPDWDPSGPYIRRLPAEDVTHLSAQMNHYMIRTEESFDLKRGTLSAVAGKNRYTDSFLTRYNRNEREDLSALRHQASFDQIHQEAMSNPEILRLHHLCCADYVTRMALKKGRDPQEDPRLSHHLHHARP